MAAEAAVSSAVQILGNLLIQKVNFLQGVEGQVRRLKEELERMQSFLKDAAKKQTNDERVRTWISQIREVAHDAEDAIEMFILNVENARRNRGLLGSCACFPCHSYYINKVGEEIESIQTRLQDIESSRQRYGIQELGEEGAESSSRRRLENVERRRRLDPWEMDRDVVGLEGDVELLHQKAILDDRKLGLSIAAIVGMGGSGKSTLARMVYNNAAVAARFNCRAWVVVSSEFTAEDVLKQIMLQLHISFDDERLKDMASMSDKLRREQILREMLHEHLMGKQYFIVLDDVWEDTHWESLRSAFPNEQDKMSRLLLTSRNNTMKKYARYVHEMKLLDSNKSWELFLKKTFMDNTNGKFLEELESVARRIVEKCHGLPLAISVAGGLLLEQKQSRSAWEKVLKGLNSYMERGESSILAILELSYQNLPPRLKSCFLSLGFFKEDANIPAERLVQVWIAQDLVMQEEVGGEETMEDIAGGYLDDLIARNLVQVKEMTMDDQIKNCQIHDLLRELSIRKAREEINFQILRKEGSSQSSHKPRHRAIYCYRGRFIESTNQNKNLRSLFVHGIISDWPSSSYWTSFKLLRILNLGYCGFGKLPDAISALIGLRYLVLSAEFSKMKVPRSLGKLENLQFLDFRNNIATMPNSVWNIESLRHLKAWRITLPKASAKISSLKNLQTLGGLLLRDSIVKQLTKMTSLRKLGIILGEISDARKLFSSLAVLENLVSLNLQDSGSLNMDGLSTLHRITKLKLGGSITRLPGANSFPPNLSYLTLRFTYLKEDPMPVLQKLPSLLYLKFRSAYDGEEMVISHDGFPRLKRLRLGGLQNLRNIKVGEGAMPGLERWEMYRISTRAVANVPEHLKSAIVYINHY